METTETMAPSTRMWTGERTLPVLIILLLLVSVTPESSYAQSFYTDTTLAIGLPTVEYLSMPALVVNLTNPTTSAINVSMWVEVENRLNQTVRVFRASALMQELDTVTMATALADLPQGAYTAYAFATSSGIVISDTRSVSFSVAQTGNLTSVLTANSMLYLAGPCAGAVPCLGNIGIPVVSVDYLSTVNSSLLVYEWVDVMNSANQSVGVFLGSAIIPAGQNMLMGAALFNMPDGNYTAVVFATTSSGVVLSRPASIFASI